MPDIHLSSASMVLLRPSQLGHFTCKVEGDKPSQSGHSLDFRREEKSFLGHPGQALHMFTQCRGG